MISMLTAYTYELDDIELAVSELLEQLDLDRNLRKNAVGLVTCYAEFIETGVVSALSERLPFDIVGCTTLATGTAGEYGMMMLSLAVLTGDDVSFSAVMSQPLPGGDALQGALRAAYGRAAASLSEAPKLIITFLPLIKNMGGEPIALGLDAISGGVPVFGLISCNDSVGLEGPQTICNGRASTDALSMVLVSGDIHPRFFLTIMPDTNIQSQKAIITSSKGNVMMEVNDIPITDYLKSLGLSAKDGMEGSSAIPFIVDYGDGTKPVARAIYSMTPEGYAACGGAMPEGSTLAIGSISYDGVLETAGQAMDELLAAPDINGALIFPCQSRNLVLGADADAEMKIITNRIGGSIPYIMGYAGGELCPAYGEAGKPFNRFHNFTFITCVL